MHRPGHGQDAPAEHAARLEHEAGADAGFLQQVRSAEPAEARADDHDAG